MTVLNVADQAPVQSVEEKIASRFGAADEMPAPQQEEAAPVDDLFELDFEGERYQLPAKLKDGFMRQKDYTQKTQETAELRKTYEHATELARAAELDRSFAESVGAEQEELSVINAYLAQMAKADWGSLSTDQILRQKLELDNVKERKAAIKESLADKKTKYEADTTARMKDLRTKARELVSKSINGFGEETEKSMRSYAASKGLTDAEFDRVSMDTRSLSILHDALQFSKVAADAKQPVLTKPGVLKPGPSNERMPAEVVSKLNFNKAIAKAHTSREKSVLIEERLAGMFAKRK